MIKAFLISIFILFFGINIALAQCDDEMGVFNCAEMFEQDNIIFLSNFTAKGKKKKKGPTERSFNWEIYLTKNTNYRFSLCCDDGLNDILMNLHNAENPDDLPLGSTFVDGVNSVFFDFSCKTEGVYNVVIKFKDGVSEDKRLCAIGIVGYVGKKKPK